MTHHDPGWERLLLSDAPPGCRLQRALFTTYSQPDTTFLAEQVLPILLGLERRPGEDREQKSFVVELCSRVRALSDRITVVSSMPKSDESRDVSGYEWLWGPVRHLVVGATGEATQHAKLWLFHWAADDGAEYLEIVVSSANLQRDAFVGQLQGAWRACVPLERKAQKARLTSWGILPAFLDALMASCGDEGRAAPFVSLLARATCPEGVQLVASVPGRHAAATLRKTPWGVAGLAAAVPPGRGAASIDVLSPFVGNWDEEGLSAWAGRLDVPTQRLSLVWIADDHPWATPTPRWTLPADALATLEACGCTLLDLRREAGNAKATDAFHRQHHVEDQRWSHAKLYRMKRGRTERVLVTSANFSPSAWGKAAADGTLHIRNFELGVALDDVAWPFADLGSLYPGRASVIDVSTAPTDAGITWARASWDGTHVVVDVRCREAASLAGVVRTNGQLLLPLPAFMPIPGSPGIHRSKQSFLASQGTPRFADIEYGAERLTLVVADERPIDDTDDQTPPDGLDAETYQSLLDEQLFEEFGGPAANDDGVDGDDGSDVEEDPTDHVGGNPVGPGTEVVEVDEEEALEASGNEIGQRTDSYQVAAQAAARLLLTVVDGWWARMQQARRRDPEGFEVEVLGRSGHRLIEAFDRLVAKKTARRMGARLAAEELRTLTMVGSDS